MTADAAKLQSVVIAEHDLTNFAAQLLQRAGFSAQDAAEMANGLVQADMRGVASHGIIHLPNWLKRVRLGLVQTGCSYSVLMESSTTARLDAQHAPGILVGARAMDMAVAKARAAGLGAVAVTNSTHFGVGALHAERATAAAMLGIALSNTTPMLTPPGGAQRLLGTNPLAVAVPDGQGGAALSIDMGLGQVTLGWVRDRMERGLGLPEGVGLDRDGRPTQDPACVLNEGVLLPMGGHKGFALALVIEVLAGVLSGAGIGSEVGSLFFDYERPQQTGHFFLAIDPCRFLPAAEFDRRLRFLMGWIRSAARADGAGPGHLPGERGRAELHRHRVHGITLVSSVAAALVEAACEYGVDPPASLAGHGPALKVD